MDAREFLDVARALIADPSEAAQRTAVGRAYYALVLEGREALRRWGFAIPPHGRVHAFVRLSLLYADAPDLKAVGLAMERLVQLRNAADYQLDVPGPFQIQSVARQVVVDAESAIARLDAIEADPNRRTAAIASIRPIGA